MSIVISNTSIANSALSKIGADRISSLDEDSKKARLCKERLPFLRVEVLAAHNWKFAKKRANLAALVSTPAFGWSYEYQIPSDYVNMVIDPTEIDTPCDYIIEGRKILADDSSLDILYIFDEDNYGNWEMLAAETLSWRLAADISYAITGSKEVAKLMMEGYGQWLKDARYSDSRQQPMRGPVTDTYITSRF